MAHPRDLDEPRAGDRLGGGTPAGGTDERVGAAVDDQRGGADLAQQGRTVARGIDRGELASGSGRIATAVEGGLGEPSEIVLVALEPG